MDRVERLIGVPAEKQTKLDDVVTLLVDAQIRTEQRFQQTDERFRQLPGGSSRANSEWSADSSKPTSGELSLPPRINGLPN